MMSSKYRLYAQYPSIAVVLSTLKSAEYSEFPEVQTLLRIYTNRANDDLSTQSHEKKFPLIVLEGLDGCGKSHTSKLVAKKLKASLEPTPPPCIIMLREKFDKHDSSLRRAYYALGNYIAALELKKILRNQAVVMDRFWHSTATYAMANELMKNSNLKLPSKDDDIYCWPADLIKPDLVIFLTVPEDVRLTRLSNRTQLTSEEKELKNSERFRILLHEIYTNMKEPQLVFVNNSRTSVQETSDYIIKMIKQL